MSMTVQTPNQKETNQLKSQSFSISQKYHTSNEGLPQGFVYVDEIDPMIISNLRYLTKENFVGEVLPGYYKNRAILSLPAALALKNVNQQLLVDGYQIVIYDSYRPQRTVDRFYEWAMDGEDDPLQPFYSPLIDKSMSFDMGYVSRKSGHTRGSTVDITIIKKGHQIKSIIYRLRELENGRLIYLLDDGTEDFGSSWDLADQASHVGNNPLIAKQYVKKRDYLIEKMQKYGFKVLDVQWWHFTLINQPYPDTYFDFDIK